ncbi:MAG TPA: hypothetical protein VH877_14290 [Polyangia bacterium]|nr:hypothetical protein [Polyangia bacterium]
MISTRDTRHQELLGALQQADVTSLPLQGGSAGSRALLQFIEQELEEPYRSSALRLIDGKPCFEAEPARFDKLLASLRQYRRLMFDRFLMAPRPFDEWRALLGSTLYGVVKYSVRLYSWQDDPHLFPAQRALLAEEAVLPMVLLIAERFPEEPLVAEPGDRLTMLSQDFTALTHKMALAGQLKKVRGEVVLKWCHANITNTTQRYCDAHGRPCLSAKLQSALASVKVKLVIFNILLDELADDVQSPELFELCARIPYAGEGVIGPVSQERLEALLAEVPRAWREYFELAARVWNAALRTLCLLVGEEAFVKHGRQLHWDYDQIVESMRFALKANRMAPDEMFEDQDVGMLLAHNMNMMAFETIDRMAIERAAPAVAAVLDRDLALYEAIREINLYLQYNGQLGNSIATLDAEIDENCVANEIVLFARKHRAGRWLLQCFAERRAALDDGDVEACDAIGAQIRQIIGQTQARRRYLAQWEEMRWRILDVMDRHPAIWKVLDVLAMMKANDQLMIMSWVYRGEI